MSDLPERAYRLADWQILYNDQEATARDPENQRSALIVLAEALHAQGVIAGDELAEMLEMAEAAYAWGVEEALTQEGNR